MKLGDLLVSIQRGALLALAPLMMGVQCEDPPLNDISAMSDNPLIQESVVMIEIDVPNIGWVPMVVPQVGIERFARRWCWLDRQANSDNTICDSTTVAGTNDLYEEYDTTALQGATMAKCQPALCLLRNEICAGMMLEEAARSPVPRELTPPGPDPQPFALGDPLLQIPQTVLETVLVAAGAPSTITTTSKIRFQPMQAPSRAAALRGALKRYGDAGIIAHAMQDWWAAAPANGAPCVDVFAAQQTNPLFIANADGTSVTWNDVYYTGFLDAASRYSETLERTVEAMRDSAQSQVAGRHSTQNEIATQWNGKVDSALAIAKLIGSGESDAPGGTQLMSGESQIGESDYPASKISPQGLPVCPPTANNEGVLKVSDNYYGKGWKADPVNAPYSAAELESAQTGKSVTVDYLLQKLNVTEKDFSTAAFDQWKHAELTGSYMIPKQTYANGAKSYYNTTPSTQATLPKGVLASHFTGTAEGDTAGKLNGPNAGKYAKTGALKALDLFQLTGAKLSQMTESPSLNLNTNVAEATNEYVSGGGMKSQGGGFRLEFHVGKAHVQDASAVEKIRVTIHGAPKKLGVTPAVPFEQYYLVHGTKGLKCVMNGSIDGAPCAPSDYLVDMNALSSAVFSENPDTRMIDFPPGHGYLYADITTMPQPGEPQALIKQAYGVYVLKKTALGLEAMGGIVPSVGGLILTPPTAPPETVWPSGATVFDVTRQVIAPVGGSLEVILANAITPNSDECSKVQTTCADLPADIWPPLESEIVGEGTSTADFEDSWRYWLSLARDASGEADRLGEELLEQGLALQEMIAQGQAELEDLCGANADPVTCGIDADNSKPPEFATLGDRDVCLWSYKGLLCDRSKLKEAYKNLPCPYPLGAQTAADAATCAQTLQPFFDNVTFDPGDPSHDPSVTPVTNKLRLVSTEGQGPTVGKCANFTALRKSQHDKLLTAGDDFAAKTEARSQFIRDNIMNEFGQGFVTDVARKLSYEEEFADNYVLRYGKNAIVFDTRRPTPRAGNDQAGAPCNIDAADESTGSTFWSSPVDCFVKPTGDSPAQCNSAVGHDSCPTNPVVSKADISHDTEHNPLRRRWAWGFGYLRRSMAVLGAITGQLDGNLKLARIFPVAYNLAGQGYIFENKYAGRPCGTDDNDNESAWVFHCAPGGEHRPIARCIPVKGIPGVGTSDNNRQYTGRPVNVNGFVPNALAFDDAADYFDGKYAGQWTVGHWPTICLQGNCAPASPVMADPQMPYCSITEHTTTTGAVATVLAAIENAGTTWKLDGDSSALVGAGMAGPAAVRAYENNNAWSTGLRDIWTDPGGNFCQPEESPTIVGAVWRALCLAPEESGPAGEDPNASATWANDEFMRFGRVSNTGELLVSAAEVRKWLSPLSKSDKSRYGQMLFDLRKGNVRDGTAPFQYELNQRNIFDALELACHAATRANTSVPVDCNNLDPENLGDEPLTTIADALECYANKVGRVAERFVVKVSPTLLERVANGEALPSGSRTGGQYLEKLNEQYAAIKRIGANYAKIRDAQVQLAIAIRTLEQIDIENDSENKASQAQALAEAYQGLASVMSTVANAQPWGAAAAMGAAAAQMAATAYNIDAIQYNAQATDAALNQKRLDLFARMQKELAAAREAADDVVLALNDLNRATADVDLVQKKAMKAKAATKLADYAGKFGEGDPQFKNVANRRIYNTRLIRYERSFKRAKQLAFLARRAIELRFGVDLERMNDDLSLVEAPKKWANDVCNMQGIDYAKVRQPNPGQPVMGYEIGQTPLPGDDFANQYIGDYVKKLEDFVNTYPIDYPLKDGDDTGVISLADDIFQVSAECSKPGPNLLYYSTDFGKNDSVAVSSDTHGWFVDGCGYELPAPDGGTDGGTDGGSDGGTAGPWNGCVTITPDALEPPLVDGGAPDAGTYGLPRQGLPETAVPYRLRNEPCVPTIGQDGQETACPDVSQFVSRGSVRQWLVGLQPGYYTASVYALLDPEAVYNPVDGGQTPAAELRIVGEDDTIVAKLALTSLSGTEWKRFDIAFQADGTSSYRFDILPSNAEQVIQTPADGGATAWPGICVAAAQVEKAIQASDGTTGGPGMWIRTDQSRDVIDRICHELKGPSFRKRFTRRCEYVCADGIKDNCPVSDGNGQPSRCFYETHFTVSLSDIESGKLIPSGQIAIGNFNFRHNLAGINAIGTGLASCDNQPSSCYYNGFLEYTLVHSGDTQIRNYTGWNMPAKLDQAYIEHGKLLATERIITNPPSSTDLGLLEPYMKHEYKGRPMEGVYTLRIWDRPGLRWEQLEDLQLVWKYHYWTRFRK